MRVLLIEDDRKIAVALGKNLQAESFAIDVARDGLKGEELAYVNDYDVIILDIMLPVQDGWATCRNLRKNNILVPIIMLTALDDVSDKIKGFEGGADDYLVKPFHFGELLARIRALIRRQSDVRSNIIERFGLRLDQNTHKAYRDSIEISLTSKEYALLEMFMMYSGKILSRQEISEHLWDMNFDPRSNVIESFVRYLRNKIDKNFDRPLIHTVRGSGYIFSDTAPRG